MSHRLTIRPEAEADAAEAFDWYEEQVSGLGSDFLLCLDAALHEKVAWGQTIYLYKIANPKSKI